MMNAFKSLALASLTCACFGSQSVIAGPQYPGSEDIFAVQFTEDGNHLVTGGSGGMSEKYDENFSGGIKLWDVNTGALVTALGQQVHIKTIFGEDYGRIGNRRWGIHSFKDIVINGNYPDGKILLLPSSLGRMDSKTGVELPEFFGGSMDLASAETKRLPLMKTAASKQQCGSTDARYEFVGPIVSSDNGRYAAVVVNTCKKENDRNVPIAQYNSTLHVVDLTSMKVTKTYNDLDSGMYAVGISNNGERVAYVGRDRFAVIDAADDSKQVIEEYKDAIFQIPRQFSTLYFNDKATKLVSLHYVYDITTGKETALSWPEGSPVTKGRTSDVKVAPDLSYFVLVKPKRSLITFGEDGLPRAYGKADKIFVVDTKTGSERELQVSDSRTEGKRCVTDVSPDGRRIAVACSGGMIKVFDAASGNTVWEQRNVGYKRQTLDRNLIQVNNDNAESSWLVAFAN